MRYEKNFLITIITLVFVILKHSLQWRGEFHLYFGPVPEFLFVNSAARRFSMAASFEGKFLSSFLYWCFHWPYLVVQVYELITCVRRANENAGNLISGVQFLIKSNITGENRQERVGFYTNVIHNHFCCIRFVCVCLWSNVSQRLSTYWLTLQSRKVSLGNYFINFLAYQKYNLFSYCPNMCHFIYCPNYNFLQSGQLAVFVCLFPLEFSGFPRVYGTQFTPLQSTIIPEQHFLFTARFSIPINRGWKRNNWISVIHYSFHFFHELFIIPLIYVLWSMSADVPPRSHVWPHVQIVPSRIPISY